MTYQIDQSGKIEKLFFRRFRTFFKTSIGYYGKSQQNNCSRKIEINEIISIHGRVDFKLIIQKPIESVNPNSTILKSYLSSKKGKTIETKNTWPISAEIAEKRLYLAFRSFIPINGSKRYDSCQ